jgi:hypothetical protein
MMTGSVTLGATGNAVCALLVTPRPLAEAAHEKRENT